MLRVRDLFQPIQSFTKSILSIRRPMAEISYRRHRFRPVVIQHAIWLYLRFTLSYRDVEDLLTERRLDISYETVRRWVLKFGPLIARKLRQRRPRPSDRWPLDEMMVGSPAGECICGARSTTRAKSTTANRTAGVVRIMDGWDARPQVG